MKPQDAHILKGQTISSLGRAVDIKSKGSGFKPRIVSNETQSRVHDSDENGLIPDLLRRESGFNGARKAPADRWKAAR